MRRIRPRGWLSPGAEPGSAVANGAGSQPACLLGDSDRVHAIPGTEFADGVGKVIAEGGLGEIEKAPHSFGRPSGHGCAKYVGLTDGQRARTSFDRNGNQLRVEHAP